MTDEPMFLVDRMLGPLTRYLRFLGYDSESAALLPEGDPGEDNHLLKKAEEEGRLLLTRDRDLASRAGERGMYIADLDLPDQIRLLHEKGLISLDVRLIRCSVCNTLLREAAADEIAGASYAPKPPDLFTFLWCPGCSRLYWNGSHTESIIRRIRGLYERGRSP